MADGLVSRLRSLRQSDKWIYSTMLLSALLSLTASFVLSVDAIALARDPNTALACNINSVLSCGTVANSWQASLFGFPNAFLGLIAEPVVITIAVASLGRVRFPRWFMISAEVVYALGVIFAYWLFFQAFYVIGALCPWCLLVTVSTTLVFTSLTHVNIRDGHLFRSERGSRLAKAFVGADLDALVVAVWLLGLAALVLTKYAPILF